MALGVDLRLSALFPSSPQAASHMYEVAIWLHAMQPYIPDFHANRDAVALIQHVSYDRAIS